MVWWTTKIFTTEVVSQWSRWLIDWLGGPGSRSFLTSSHIGVLCCHFVAKCLPAFAYKAILVQHLPGLLVNDFSS
jgi:hypothetical protein